MQKIKSNIRASKSAIIHGTGSVNLIANYYRLIDTQHYLLEETIQMMRKLRYHAETDDYIPFTMYGKLFSMSEVTQLIQVRANVLLYSRKDAIF